MDRVKFRGYIDGEFYVIEVICDESNREELLEILNMVGNCDVEVIDNYQITEGILVANLEETNVK